MAFAQNLRRLRLERFLSQGELARRAGRHGVNLTRLEAGATAPATRTVRVLAAALSDAAPTGSRVSYHLDTRSDEGEPRKRRPAAMRTEPGAVRATGDDRGQASRSVEANMSDFAGGIRQSVQAARASATKQQRDAQDRHEEDEAGWRKQKRPRGLGLPELIWQQIRAAEDAADGALKVDRRSGIALTTFQLWWQEGQPDRALQIVVDETEGLIQASWVVPPGYGQPVDAPSVETFGFDLAKLEAAIALLVDQRRWARGAIPMIPW